jgi:dipeptidyl aminopeptidase/acylaminoacyl peptidase
VVLDAVGEADPTPLTSKVLVEGGRLEDSGRYLVFEGKDLSTMPGGDNRILGVLSLHDGALTMSVPLATKIDDDSAWTVFWKRDGAFFSASGQRESAASCEPSGLVLRDVDVTTATVNELPFGDGEVTSAVPSPDGRMLLFATRKLGPCTAAPPTEANRGVLSRAHLWAPSADHALRWTVDGVLTAAAWSPASNAVAVALDATIRILSPERASGAPSTIASWPGTAPLAWSPDGAHVASREGALPKRMLVPTRSAERSARVASTLRRDWFVSTRSS